MAVRLQMSLASWRWLSVFKVVTPMPELSSNQASNTDIPDNIGLSRSQALFQCIT